MDNYTKNFLIFLAIFLAIGAIPIFFLYRAGEYTCLTDIVTNQIKSQKKIIYGTALHDNMHSYKHQLLNATKPEIIAFGSSRVMQFRQHMFKKKFVNLGGAFKSVNEGLTLADDIVDKHPEIVIIGVDTWWFNDKTQNPDNQYIEHDDVYPSPSPFDAYTVFSWLINDKINTSQITDILLHGSVDYGVAGQLKDGFGPDGSYYYTSIITGAKKHPDFLFHNTFKRIEHGTKKFEYNKVANNGSVINFKALLNIFNEKEIHYIIIFPPFANKVLGKIKEMSQQYAYIDDLKKNFRDNGISYYDFTDPALINSPDCEFIDGFHGGEVTYMRILLKLAEKYPFFNTYVDQDYLSDSIITNQGKCFIRDGSITSKPEVDFLGFGCNKF